MSLTTFLHIVIESGFALFCTLTALYMRTFRAISPRWARTLSYGLVTNAVINIADGMAYFFRGNMSPTGYYMVRISNFVVFVGMYLLLALGNSLLDKVLEEKGGGRNKRLRDLTYILCLVGIVLLVLSRVFGFYYAFDEQNRYYRSTGYALFPLIGVAAIILMLIRTVRERKTLTRQEFFVFQCFWLLPVAGALAQIAYYGISLSNIANSISLLIMFNVFMKEAVASIIIKETTELSAEGIEALSESFDRFLKGAGTERQNRIRIRFTLEEALLSMRRRFGSHSKVRVNAGFILGKPTIRIEQSGNPFNPFSKSRQDRDDWSSGLLQQAGLSPTYNYTRGYNVIKIALARASLNPVMTVMIAIIFGLLTGGVARAALSPVDANFFAYELLEPLYDLWNNILYSVAAPAMFVIVASTILDTREVEEQGGSGRLITGRYFGVSLLVGVITFMAADMLRPDAFASQEFNRHTIAELLQGLFRVVPQNILDPIKDFNTAQLILMGIVIAYAIMAIGQHNGVVANAIYELNMISGRLAQWIAGVMPVFTVFLTAQMVLEDNAGQLVGLLKIMPFAIIVSLIVMLFTLVCVGARMKIDPRMLLKKLLPSFLLTLKTGQVAETYSFAELCCRRDLGIQKIFTQKVLPLGLVLYMPVSIIGMLTFAAFGAFRSGVEITPVWMLTAIVFALILLIAAPPIPGINLLSYIVLMGQLGISKDYVIYAMIFDIIFNVFASAANQMMLQLDLILQADRVGLLNHEILSAPVVSKAQNNK